MHGELHSSNVLNRFVSGSSPRAWGTPLKPIKTACFWRFIPTCMGNSSPEMYFHTRHSVHPHVHGELLDRPPGDELVVGSSPRAWGTLIRHNLSISLIRFIPTCMGNSSSSFCSCALFTVHPHVHGELCRCLFNLSLIYGSSPRAWGTRCGDDIII